MTQKYIENCLQCGRKLGTRNYTSRGSKITHFCHICYSKPKDEDKCISLTNQKRKCKMRKLNGSEYCAMHSTKRSIIDD